MPYVRVDMKFKSSPKFTFFSLGTQTQKVRQRRKEETDKLGNPEILKTFVITVHGNLKAFPSSFFSDILFCTS
jgi:hypothetical protein